MEKQKQKQIILINGPSSSGKTTLAKALQKMISEKIHKQYVIVSIDDFLKMSPTEPIFEDDVFNITGKMCETAVVQINSCDGLIIEHVITSERIFRIFSEYLAPYSVRTIRLTCSLNALREREELRKDRCLGSAEASAKYLFPKEGYDLVIDTSKASLTELSKEVLDFFTDL